MIRTKGEPYKLIIIDRHMPGMDGFELAEYIKNDPRLSSSVMIMMTYSDSFNIDLARINKLGIAGYLLKPVKRLDLRDIIIVQSIAAGKNNKRKGRASPNSEPI